MLEWHLLALEPAEEELAGDAAHQEEARGGAQLHRLDREPGGGHGASGEGGWGNANG